MYVETNKSFFFFRCLLIILQRSSSIIINISSYYHNKNAYHSNILLNNYHFLLRLLSFHFYCYTYLMSCLQFTITKTLFILIQEHTLGEKKQYNANEVLFSLSFFPQRVKIYF